MSIYEQLAEPLTNAMIETRLAALRSWLAVDKPDLDVSDPVLTSLWLGPVAKLLADRDRVLDSLATYGQLSVNAINSVTDPILQAALRDQLAEDLLVSVAPASLASGELTLTFSTDRAVVLPRGSQFTVNSLVYVTNEALTFRPRDRLSDAVNERELVRVADGRWQAVVSVVSQEVGATANIPEGTVLTAETELAGLVSVVSSSSFVGGRDQNALQDIIDSVFNQTVFRTMGTRDQIVSLLQTRTELGSIRQVGVIGFGDVEMERDHQFGFPLGGGCADLYLASADYPTSQEVVVTAAALTSNSTEVRYTVAVGRDVSPGYFRVVSAVDELTGTSLTLKSEDRGLDLTAELGSQTPAIQTARQGGFSRYQTASLQFTGPVPEGFVDSGTPVDRTVRMRLQRLNGIDTAQSLVSNRTVRWLTGDTLVRAAIPIFLEITLRLTTSFDSEVINQDELKALVAETVMRRPMRQRLYASEIIGPIAKLLPLDVAVSQVRFDGILVKPTGEQARLSGVDQFDCPHVPAEQLTARTVAMYTSIRDITIVVERLVTLETP